MLVSQWCMVGAVLLLAGVTIVLTSEIRQNARLKRVMSALIVQGVLGTAISFSTESLALSLILACLLLSAVAYMVLQCRPLEVETARHEPGC